MSSVRTLAAVGVVFMGCAGNPAPGAVGTDENGGPAMPAGHAEASFRGPHGHHHPVCKPTPRHRGKLAGCGTATVDGTMARREWRHADSIRFDANLPDGGTTSARLFVMNDDANLYVALRFARAVVDPGNSLGLEFDNDHDCTRENGDDAVVMNPDIGDLTDDFRTNDPPCPPGSPPAACGPRDVDAGGTNDGHGAFANDGAFTVYEISHPLDSGDVGHDFALGAGDRVGMFVFLRMIGAGGVFPDDFGDTTFPEDGFLEVRIKHCGHGDDGDDGDDDDRGDDD